MIKNINDYVDLVQQKYPELSKTDIKTILTFGWRQVGAMSKCGGDVRLNSNLKHIWVYFGDLPRNSIGYFKHYIKKLKVKIKILYKRKHISWDNYYYFSLNECEQLRLLSGETLNVLLYRIKNECWIEKYDEPYLYRISNIPYKGYHAQHCLTPKDTVELIEKRKHLSLNDIMTDNKFYKELH